MKRLQNLQPFFAGRIYHVTLEDLKLQFGLSPSVSQEKAITNIYGPTLLLAVPGSGKTTVLIGRIGYMIFVEGIDPASILTITYTVAATKDMEQRFLNTFGGNGLLVKRVPEFRTINGISQKILHYFGRLTGKEAYGLIGKEGSNLIKQVFYKITGQFATEYDLKTIQTGISYVKNMGLSQEEIKKHKIDLEDFYLIYQEYQKGLKECKCMDFDDQMVFALRILKEFPTVLEYFQNQYPYICVDEAQDTSKIQHEMIALLSGKKQNVFMVGDEDQSIYGFRAAFPQALVNFKEQYPSATILYMEENYRSNRQIIERADCLIQDNQNRHEKKMKTVKVEDGAVRKIQVQSRKEQYQRLLDEIQTDCSPTAILYRNHESALPLVDLLERKNISYGMKGYDGSVFSHPVIQDLIDFMKLALDPDDLLTFQRIYYKMNAGISKQLVSRLQNNGSRHHALLKQLANDPDCSPYTRKQCLILEQHFSALEKEEPYKAIRRIRFHMGYQEFVNRMNMDEGKMETLELMAVWEHSLSGFLERINDLKEILQENHFHKDSNLILSTIHASKGLEYQKVILIDMLQGVLPSVDQPDERNQKTYQQEQDLYEEERRIYYVAMTRAKEELGIFTFLEKDTSDFSKRVFEKAAHGKTIFSGLKKKETIDLELFLVGSMVHHIRYGVGKILHRDQEQVEILFQGEAKPRKISLSYALQHGILQLESGMVK